MPNVLEQKLNDVRKRLEGINIHELRKIGRVVGVQSPTNKLFENLLEEILLIASGEKDPCPRSTKGKPPKSNEYNVELVSLINNCREDHIADKQANLAQVERVQIANDYDDNDKTYSGVLELADKYWFLRTDNCQISSKEDVFIHNSFVQRFKLRVGDYIVCKAHHRSDNECPAVTYIFTVNGKRPDFLNPRPTYDKLVPCYPDKRFTLESENCSLTERIIDLFAPVGNGQRALIVSPPKAGKTTILKKIAQALTKNYPQTKVIVLLIDERPEEVTDIKRSVDGAEVIYSTFDKNDQNHVRVATLALEMAKRQVELGQDVVVLMDSITRLARAYNNTCNSGRTLTGGLDTQAMVEPKKLFGAARNVENGGSLTIIATALVDTGSKLDDVIYEEFKSTGNMEIVLSRDLAERRVFPAIDIRASGARKEELLLSQAELETADKIRYRLGKEITTKGLFETVAMSANNDELCRKIDDWLKIYKNDR